MLLNCDWQVIWVWDFPQKGMASCVVLTACLQDFRSSMLGDGGLLSLFPKRRDGEGKELDNAAVATVTVLLFHPSSTTDW